MNEKELTCTCGHAHSHKEDKNSHKNHHEAHNHPEGCACGHAHAEQDSNTGKEQSCGCGHAHAEQDSNKGKEQSCGCGHAHAEQDSNTGKEQSCGCGHAHAEQDSHKGKEQSCGCGLCGLENLSQVESIEEEKQESRFALPIKVIATLVAVALPMLITLPQWAEALVLGAATLMWGWELIISGAKGLFRLSLDENTLMTIATVAAFALGEYTEALMLVVLFSIGEILEEKAVKKSRRDIAAVINIRPQTANRIEASGEVVSILSKEIRVGDSLLVKVGERVPVDCEIIEGETSLDQAALTGEAIAVGVEKGDKALSGAVNLSKAIRCKAISGFEDSTASRIIKMVEEASAQKGQTEKLITRFAKIYTPIVVICALAVAIVPPLIGFGSFQTWIMRSLVFLVASCPCALVISVPLAFYSGVGAISKQGVLIKGTKFLEPLAKAETMVFDKTGTITTGELTLSQVTEIREGSNLLRVSAIAESYSNHPMAQAIVKAYEASLSGDEALTSSAARLGSEKASSVEEIAGKGVKLILEGKRILCGGARLMNENGVSVSNLPKANVYTAVEGEAIGYFILSDSPRPEAAQAISGLKNLGISKTVMLTGDSAVSAKIVQEKCGIDEVRSDLLPQDKSSILAQLKQGGGSVVFVGDGINDAPVLAAADVGIAMGFGSDAAIESADAVLLSEKLTSLVTAIEISRRTISIVKFNIWFIFIVKALVLGLGVFGITNIWMAVVADVGVSILTVLNAVRILRASR